MKTKRQIMEEVKQTLRISDFKRPYIYKMGGTQTLHVEGLGVESFDDREYYSGRGAKYNHSINHDNKGDIYVNAAEVEAYIQRETAARWDSEKAADIYRRQRREYSKMRKQKEDAGEELTISAENCKDIYNIDAVVKFAAEKGFAVSREAIEHNHDAWQCDCKSGFRDSIYHVFTPCGCNPLRFDLTRLSEDNSDWQTTYWA